MFLDPALLNARTIAVKTTTLSAVTFAIKTSSRISTCFIVPQIISCSGCIRRSRGRAVQPQPPGAFSTAVWRSNGMLPNAVASAVRITSDSPAASVIFPTFCLHCCDLRLITTVANFITSVMSRPVNTIVLPLGRCTPGR